MNSFESMCETFGSLFRKKSYLLLVKTNFESPQAAFKPKKNNFPKM